jgi:cyanophycin synthetase
VLHVIPDATDALREALRRAEPGDVVVVFYEELEPVLKTLRSAKGQEGRPEAPPQKAASQS